MVLRAQGQRGDQRVQDLLALHLPPILLVDSRIKQAGRLGLWAHRPLLLDHVRIVYLRTHFVICWLLALYGLDYLISLGLLVRHWKGDVWLAEGDGPRGPLVQ